MLHGEIVTDATPKTTRCVVLLRGASSARRHRARPGRCGVDPLRRTPRTGGSRLPDPPRTIVSMPTPDTELRARIVAAAVEAYRATDFHRVGPDEVAVRADVAVAELHRVYPTWELLVVAVTDRWLNGSRRAAWAVAERDGAVAYLRALLEAGLAEPALVRLRIAVLSAASNPGHPAAGWFHAQYTQSFEDVTLALVRDVVAGREPRGASPRHAAEQLMALYEGLQLQSLLREDAEPLAGFDRAVTRMRVGWAEARVAV